FLQTFLIFTLKHFKLSEDVVNRILQVVLDLHHFKSSLFIFAATILQSSLSIHHISNLDNMYIKSYSYSLFSSLPGVLTPVRAINGFDMPLPVAVCSGLVNPLAPRKVMVFPQPLPQAINLWASQLFTYEKVYTQDPNPLGTSPLFVPRTW
ncbi:hypothetical protein Tco_1505144, partial [Tanacetum coccineum]